MTKTNQQDNASKPAPWVLIVEDDALVNKAYSAKLTNENIAYKIAEDGETAITLLKGGDMPALILLDLMLPKKNGFEVLEEIKKDGRLKDIPVVIMSNLGQEADAKRGIALGAAEYLIKANVTIEDIVKKVRRYLDL